MPRNVTQKEKYLPKLLEYIDLVNKIPGDIYLPSRQHAYHVTLERNGLQFTDAIRVEEIIKTYETFLEKLPRELRNYVFSDRDLDSVERKIDHLTALKLGLKVLAYSVTQEMIDEEPINLTFDSLQEFAPDYLPTLTIKLGVNENGFIELQSTEFFDFVTVNRIPARRIRECVICEKVFWANRSDKITCSKPCGNILRQRAWRNRNSEEINAKRRSNYAYKRKAVTRKKEKGHGPL
jgi:hypothetical protein